jgi:hypothetical protein
VQAERDAPVYGADQIEIAADPATVWGTLTDTPGWAATRSPSGNVSATLPRIPAPKVGRQRPGTRLCLHISGK